MSEMLLSDEYVVSVCDPNYTKLDILAYITDFCNYSCWYCYNNIECERKHLDLDRLLRYVSFLKNVSKRDIEIELIGGEPSVHPMLIQFCKSCQSFSDITMYTNYSCDFELYTKLIELGVEFDITYHQESSKINEAVIDNILRTPHANIRGITIMLDKNIFDKCVQIYHQLKHLMVGVDVDIQLVIVGDKIDDYTDGQIRWYEKTIHDDIHKNFLLRTNRSNIYVSHNQLYSITNQKYHRWMCNSGRDLLYVHVDGNVYRCDGYFNAKKASLGNIYYNFPAPQLPSLCMVQNCPFQDNVLKRRVFKT